MFHANAWGLPYAAWLVGADLILPGRAPQPATLAQLIAEKKPTLAAGVPTVWSDLLRYGESAALELGSLRTILCGGAAVPVALMQRYQQDYGVPIIQAWGLTETGPLAALSFPPKHAAPSEEWHWRGQAGRILPGVELRVSDDEGATLPWDGNSVGEIEASGPWVTARYWQNPSGDRFHDGWLRTGDLGAISACGFLQITDRQKDVIKSGGEWISSLGLEEALRCHPAVLEVAVIAVPDPRWQERPMACVVTRPGSSVDIDELRAHLEARVVRWWVPERWCFIGAIPRTAVGKIDKKLLRAQHAQGLFDVRSVTREAQS
jgi:fatty-acyl-CoA synthase